MNSCDGASCIGVVMIAGVFAGVLLALLEIMSSGIMSILEEPALKEPADAMLEELLPPLLIISASP